MGIKNKIVQGICIECPESNEGFVYVGMENVDKDRWFLKVGPGDKQYMSTEGSPAIGYKLENFSMLVGFILDTYEITIIPEMPERGE